MRIAHKIFALCKSESENALAFFNLLGPVILNGINFFTVPVFTRLLGTENFGIVSVYTAWVSIFAIVVGLQTSGTISVAKIHIPSQCQWAYRSSVLSLSMCSMIIVSIIAVIFIGPISSFLNLSAETIIIMLLQSFGIYVISFTTTIFTYDKQARKTFLLSVVTAISTVILSLILLLVTGEGQARAYARIWGIAIPNIAIGVMFFIVFLVRGKVLYSKEYWKFCIPLALPLIFHGLSHIVLLQADKIMLQKMTDYDTAGIYSFVVTFTHLISIIWSALNNTWVPFYYEDMKNGRMDVIQQRTRNYVVLFTVLVMGFILVSPEVAKLFASKDFWSGIDLIPLFAVGMFMVFLYSFPVNFQLYYKSSIFVAIGTASAAVVNVVLNYLLIPQYGMLGAATATMTSYIALFVFHQMIAKYVLKHSYHFSVKDYGISLLAVGFTVALFYLLKDFWYIRWAIGTALGIILLKRILKNKMIF